MSGRLAYTAQQEVAALRNIRAELQMESRDLREQRDALAAALRDLLTDYDAAVDDGMLGAHSDREAHAIGVSRAARDVLRKYGLEEDHDG